MNYMSSMKKYYRQNISKRDLHTTGVATNSNKC